MVGGQVADDGRLDVVAALHAVVAESLAADEHPPIAARLADRGLMSVDRLLVDDRAQPVLAKQRVANRDRLGLLDEQLDQLVVDWLLDVDPRVRRALLAAETEGAAEDALGGLLEVRRARDDGRVLAAHLDDRRLGELRREER